MPGRPKQGVLRFGRRAGQAIPSALVLLIFCLGLRCAPSFLRRSVPLEATPQEILKSVASNVSLLQELEGKLKVEIRDDRQVETATVKVFYRKPDWLKIEIKGPLGLTVANIQVKNDTMRVYYPLSKYCVAGRPSPEHFELMTGLWLDVAVFQRLFFGDEILLAEMEDHLIDFSREGKAYRLSFRWNGAEQRHWVDPRSLLLTRSEFYDDLEMLQMEHVYKNYRKFDGVRLPTRVEMIRQDSLQRMRMDLLEGEVNGGIPDDRFELHLPHDVKCIDVYQ